MNDEEKRVAEIYRKSFEYGGAYEYGRRVGLAEREEEITRLREALGRYGFHDDACNYRDTHLQPKPKTCSCGLSVALAKPNSLA